MELIPSHLKHVFQEEQQPTAQTNPFAAAANGSPQLLLQTAVNLWDTEVLDV